MVKEKSFQPMQQLDLGADGGPEFLIDIEPCRAYIRLSKAPEPSHREYSGLAKGKKRNRTLLEFMDSEREDRSATGTGPLVAKPAEPTESRATAEKKTAEKSAAKKEPREEADKEYATEPLLALDEGKIRLTLNYPLAAIVCFMVVVTVICAVLIGWKLGRDRTDEKYRAALSGRPEIIDQSIPGMEELEGQAENLDRLN